MSSNYTAKDVKTLSAVEAFREKIGMYAGSDGLGLEDNTGIVKAYLEIYDNAADECLNKHSDLINVVVSVQGNNAVYTIQDHGRGIPCDNMADGRPALEVLLTDAHSGKHYCPLL